MILVSAIYLLSNPSPSYHQALSLLRIVQPDHRHNLYLLCEKLLCPLSVRGQQEHKKSKRKTHRIRNIRMIISVFPAPAGVARLADFLALIVPRFRCDKSDFEGLVALYFRVFWKPRIHS